MADFTPRTSDVRKAWRAVQLGKPEATAEFNRWLANVRAEAVKEAAQKIDFEWEVFTASDGYPSIRQHGKSPSELLMEFAKSIREEAQ